MIRHRLMIAREFRIAGWVLGVPSLAALVFFVSALVTTGNPPSDSSGPLDIRIYGLVGLLSNGMRVVGKALGAFIAVADWLFTMLAVAAFALTLLALILYAMGRGIAKGATWARIGGGLIAVATLFEGVMTITSAPRDAAIVAALFVAASLHALWVLVWKFAPAGS